MQWSKHQIERSSRESTCPCSCLRVRIIGPNGAGERLSGSKVGNCTSDGNGAHWTKTLLPAFFATCCQPRYQRSCQASSLAVEGEVSGILLIWNEVFEKKLVIWKGFLSFCGPRMCSCSPFRWRVCLAQRSLWISFERWLHFPGWTNNHFVYKLHNNCSSIFWKTYMEDAGGNQAVQRTWVVLMLGWLSFRRRQNHCHLFHSWIIRSCSINL